MFLPLVFASVLSESGKNATQSPFLELELS
ncbi:hypothetical protein N871_00535 [Helicobacter pylori X47-2AL]|uniref:Uncharacterized protein n=1 Tax=Helicobacter pylori X47-2AL TaxID=1386083 RepID=V6LKK7_HELPX|nr:hypothetical protein N871_00535 [Helicobacter pylori X47-2AL]